VLAPVVTPARRFTAMRHAELLAQIPIFEGLSVKDAEALGKRLTDRERHVHRALGRGAGVSCLGGRFASCSRGRVLSDNYTSPSH